MKVAEFARIQIQFFADTTVLLRVQLLSDQFSYILVVLAQTCRTARA
jgi:hypothetical protein